MLTGLSLFVLALLQTPSEATAIAAPLSEQAATTKVYIVELRGPLSETWSSMLRRAHQLALSSEAEHLLVVIDSPGGEIELMKRLGDHLDAISKDLHTICLIDREALSAAAYVAISCEQVLMRPAASIGAAMPILVGPGGMMPEIDDDLREKMNSAFRAQFRSWAELHNRDGRIAEAFVDSGIELKKINLRGEPRLVNGREYDDLLQKGEAPHFLETLCATGELLTLTSTQAIEFAYCDGVVEDVDDALAWLGFSPSSKVLVVPTWSETLVTVIGSWSWLLMLAAAFFMVVAFNIPGMGAPEGAAVACIGVFLFHGYLIGLAEWTEVLLIIGGTIFIALEIFLVPGTLVAGASGGLMLVGGLVLAMQDFVLPDGAIESDVLRHNLTLVFGVLLGAPLLGLLAVRKLVRTPLGGFLATTPTEGLAGSISITATIGSEAQCLTPLRPAGSVSIGGKRFDAISRGDFLEVGAMVRVVGGRGSSLLVEALQPNHSESES